MSGSHEPQSTSQSGHDEKNTQERIAMIRALTAFLTIRRRSLYCVSLLLCGGFSQIAPAQTPSPLQEWQYSGGIILAKLFQPDLPEFRTIVGLASDLQPAYDGARAYRVEGGPVINAYYRDVAFISTGDGIGYNFLHGDHYQVGLSMTYDLGRKVTQDYSNLHGMGDISAAPVGKVYASWVISRKLPLILRVDARQFMGGAQGAIGDIAVYTPLPGSSKTFVMFAGPSVTLATRHYMQVLYGVTPQQSAASGHPVYDILHDGTTAAGVGFSATKFFGQHWLLNLDGAINEIRGSPSRSPLMEKTAQHIVALSVNYQF
jgi:outer membrane scaffolding protein for murein synthesis (MipA/OmpV family)